MSQTKAKGKKDPKGKKKQKHNQPTIPRDRRINLYENLDPLFDKETQRRVGLRIPCPIYVQDPSVFGIEEIDLRWEPGLAGGPTSSRLAVVDFDADTGLLTEPARWNEKEWAFTDPEGGPITKSAFTAAGGGTLTGKISKSFHFHQVNAWATVQSVLEFFEDPWVLGRPVPWGLAGNRLILVPHAGYGENAFYDRDSKSLQLYYYGDPEAPKFTCLSHDILAHETGHAILDGIRPYYHEHSSPQTTAFHEFVADLTAILTAFRNNVLRHELAKLEDLDRDYLIGNLAQEFGKSVAGHPYLRTAHNEMVMGDVDDDDPPHRVSQVLTGALFDILAELTRQYLSRPGKTPKQAFWNAADRIRPIALQPLDYLPPVDVQFLDYARAVLRCHRLANPRDRQGYRELILETFHQRGLCCLSEEDHEAGRCELNSDAPPQGLIHHDVDRIAASRAAAYCFLHDNRKQLRIPEDQDIVVADLYETRKWDVGRHRLPTEIVLEYVWEEPIELRDARFGPLRGQTVNLLCGGTLVFDDRGNVVSWARKPGTQVDNDAELGTRRQKQLLDHAARQARSVAFGLMEDAEADQLGQLAPPVVARLRDGAVRLEVTPGLRDDELRTVERLAKRPKGEPATDEDENEDEEYGAESWTTSF